MSRAVSDIQASAFEGARGALNVVQVLTEVLADKMAEIHGGDCRVHIDHENGVVMVASRLERSAPRKRGEAA